MAGQTADLTTRVVAEGGRRAGRAFRRGVLSMGAFLITLIFLIAGAGAAALFFALLAIAFFVGAAFSLTRS